MTLSLPSDWKSVLVPAALDEEQPIIRPSAKIAARDYRPSGRFPIIDQSQNPIAGWTDSEAAVLRTPRPVIIFGDHSRTFKYADGPFAAGADGTLILNPSKEFDPKFLYFACLDLEIPSRGYNRHYTVLKELSVPKPKPAEQRKIAAVLGKVQAAVEVEGELIRVTRELKQAALRQLFTRGLRCEPQKQTDLGPIPESWDVVPLGTLFETQLGKMLSPKAKQGDTPLPYLRNKNVQWGRIELDDVLTMDFDAREKAKFRLQPGNLLICEGGIVGRCAIWRGQIEECYYQKALHRVRPLSDESSNEFLAYWFEHAFQFSNLYRLGGANSTIVHLPEVQLLRLQIPKPDPAEQREIAKHLAAIDAKLAHHEARRKLLRELFRTLLRDLMTARRRVTHLDLADLSL